MAANAMQVDPPDVSQLRRWASLETILARPSAFGGETGALHLPGVESFEPDPELHEAITGACILVVGAGGLGCELLKDLALNGFQDIHVIDLDTIDITNLNRQFLFRKKDVGQAKSNVAAAFVNGRVPGVNVVPHFGKLQDFDKEWYKQFQLVIAGLDNIEARRWLNATLCELVEFEEDGTPKAETVIPLIDGGTEGFKGQARVILPMHTECFDCTASMFPPPRGKAMCTMEANPRQPEDCPLYVYMKLEESSGQDLQASAGTFGVNEQAFFNPAGASAEGATAAAEWVNVVVLRNDNAFDDASIVPSYSIKLPDGSETSEVGPGALMSLKDAWHRAFGKTRVDKDQREHMMWIYTVAADRAGAFGISGLTYDKTLGAVKNIIPAVASTNAIISAACVQEALKVLSYCGQVCNTYMLYNGQSMNGGVDCNTLQFDRDENCSACQEPKIIDVDPAETVGHLVGRLPTDAAFDPPIVHPQLCDSMGEVFAATQGKLAELKAGNLDRPVSEFLDHMESVRITDTTWGTDVDHRKIKVRFT